MVGPGLRTQEMEGSVLLRFLRSRGIGMDDEDVQQPSLICRPRLGRVGSVVWTPTVCLEAEGFS